VRGPLVAKAFTLYATGTWSLDSLGDELSARGLRTKAGRRVTRNGVATVLHNPFYIGLIRIERTQETFQGAHPPLIEKSLFDRVQAVLDGRSPHKVRHHSFRYQRLLRCFSCRRALAASRHRGHVYYRCQGKTCPTTCLREERMDDVLRAATSCFSLSEAEWADVVADVNLILASRKTDATDDLRNLSLAMAAVDDRVTRLTDAYVDQIVDRETYLSRKERLLGERAALSSPKALLEAGVDEIQHRAQEILELAKTLGNMADLENDEEFRKLLKDTTSNLPVSEKKEPPRVKPRTGRAHDVAKIIIDHCDSLPPGRSFRASAIGSVKEFYVTSGVLRKTTRSAGGAIHRCLAD
jgi:site-specific DNA recombinase